MRYRVAAAFAGLAFLVALAAGLAGGVRFGTVLLRALVGAGVLAALAAVAVAILQRYVPGLLAPPAAPGESAQAVGEPEAEAPRIDIVLPEENPLEDAIAADLEPAEETAEAAEELGPAPPGPSDDAVESTGGLPPVEELAPEPSGATIEDAEAEVLEAEGDETLPSLDGLDMESSEPPESAPGRPAAAGPGGARVDPSQAARAMRTWLKRDHEG